MLRLLHPFTPFVTEALYGFLKKACENNPIIYNQERDWEEHLIIARWPEDMPVEDWEEGVIKDFELTQEIVRSIRNLRSEYKVDPGQTIEAVYLSYQMADFLREHKNLLIDLAGLKATNFWFLNPSLIKAT